MDSIQINATLNETIIHSEDLSYFAPEVKDLNSAVTILVILMGWLKIL